MRHSKKIIAPVAIAVAIGGGTLAITSSADAGASKHATVTMKNIKFMPKKVTIAKGGTVTFKWADGQTPHNVTPVGRLKFQRLGTTTRGAKTVKFTKSGVYKYECTIHPGMTGEIDVR